MKTVSVIKKHSFAHRCRNVGETYEVPDKYAHLFQLMGLVAVILPPVVKKPVAPPNPIPPENILWNPSKGIVTKRQYQRRDMKAED